MLARPSRIVVAFAFAAVAWLSAASCPANAIKA